LGDFVGREEQESWTFGLCPQVILLVPRLSIISISDEVTFTVFWCRSRDVLRDNFMNHGILPCRFPEWIILGPPMDVGDAECALDSKPNSDRQGTTDHIDDIPVVSRDEDLDLAKTTERTSPELVSRRPASSCRFQRKGGSDDKLDWVLWEAG
jgi:hypothetical protein